MAFLESFLLSAGSDVSDGFCRSTSFVTVGIDFKYSFLFRSKKIVLFKLYNSISDTDVTVICDSLK